MTPSLINQGILLSDKHFYNPNTHLNSSNLFTAVTNRSGYELEDIGIVNTWAQMYRHVQPLYNFNDIAKKEVYIKSSTGFKWQTPVALENPKVVELLTDEVEVGRGEEEFKVIFDKAFSVTETITYDHLYSDISAIVVDEPYKTVSGYVHTLKVFGSNVKHKAFSREVFATGTQWYSISAHRGDEFDTKASSFSTDIGMREWAMYLGTSEAAADFHFTKKAVLELLHNKDSRLRVCQLTKFDQNSEGYKYMIGNPGTHLSQVLANVYKGDKKAMNKDVEGKNWFWEIEKITMDKLMKDYIMNLMWSTGGSTQIEVDRINAAPGLYWQHKLLGNVVKYNLTQMSLDYLRKKIEAHLDARIDFNQESTLILKVGAAIYNILEKEIQKEFAGSGIVLAVEDSERFLSGDKYNLDFVMRFKSFRLHRFPKVKIVLQHEPALDPTFGNEYSNPIVEGGYRLSSYTIILYDLNDIENDNIKIVKWEGDSKLRYKKQVGNLDWLDKSYDFISTGDFSGMRGEMFLKHAAVWVKDASKMLMFERINPNR